MAKNDDLKKSVYVKNNTGKYVKSSRVKNRINKVAKKPIRGIKTRTRKYVMQPIKNSVEKNVEDFNDSVNFVRDDVNNKFSEVKSNYNNIKNDVNNIREKGLKNVSKDYLYDKAEGIKNLRKRLLK